MRRRDEIRSDQRKAEMRILRIDVHSGGSRGFLEGKGAAGGGSAGERIKDGMKTYSCSTCGAELIANETTAVMRCPYCGNQTIVPGQFSGSIRPDHIIPFAHTKDQAISSYHQYYQKRFLLPKSFLTDNHVSEIQGVYVPFWLFSGKASIDATYDAVDVQSSQEYETLTHYDVTRKGYLSYEKVPTDASERMEDALMDSVEPYNMEEIKPFSLSYLPGFLAERFDVEQKDNVERAHKRIKATISEQTKKTVKHNRIESEQEQVTISDRIWTVSGLAFDDPLE